MNEENKQIITWYGLLRLSGSSTLGFAGVTHVKDIINYLIGRIRTPENQCTRHKFKKKTKATSSWKTGKDNWCKTTWSHILITLEQESLFTKLHIFCTSKKGQYFPCRNPGCKGAINTINKRKDFSEMLFKKTEESSSRTSTRITGIAHKSKKGKKGKQELKDLKKNIKPKFRGQMENFKSTLRRKRKSTPKLSNGKTFFKVFFNF